VRDLRALGRPGEAEQADGFEGSGPKEPFQAALGKHAARLVAVVVVAPEPRVVGEVGDEVRQVDRDERPRHRQGAEAPLLVHGLEGLEESEDEGVGESGEQRETQHDRLGDQHDPRAHPDRSEFFERDSGGFQLIWAVDIWVFARLATAFCFFVEDDCCAALGHEEVDRLRAAVEDQLDPEVPAPVQEAFNRAADYAADGGTDAGGEDDERERELLLVGFV
jgi:hypothetical protein